MTANDLDIRSFATEPNKVDVKWSLPYEMEMARIGGNISISDWNAMPGTPLWLHGAWSVSKCHILIEHQLSSKLDRVVTEAYQNAK